MENAVEALKIAFAVGMFVLALTLSISSFSNANIAITEIVSMRDRETEYTYVEPSKNLTRVVGVETIVPTMYRAYKENIEIYFVDKDGKPLGLYYKTNNTGNRVLENNEPIMVNYINLALESFASVEDAIEHLNILLDQKENYKEKKYENQFIHIDGLYEYFSGKQFEEQLGEYTQGSGTTEITKRVITYKLTN